MLCLPEGANDFVAANRRFLEQGMEQLMPRATGKEWLDHGLHERGRAIAGPRVTPAFELVRLWNVPMAKLRAFVAIQSEVNRARNFWKQLGELKVHRRVVSRIGADHDQRLDRTG